MVGKPQQDWGEPLQIKIQSTEILKRPEYKDDLRYIWVVLKNEKSNLTSVVLVSYKFAKKGGNHTITGVTEAVSCMFENKEFGNYSTLEVMSFKMSER